jgi:hypothetical protein
MCTLCSIVYVSKSKLNNPTAKDIKQLDKKQKPPQKNAEYYQAGFTGTQVRMFGREDRNIFEKKPTRLNYDNWREAFDGTRDFLLSQDIPKEAKDAIWKIDDANNILINSIKVIIRTKGTRDHKNAVKTSIAWLEKALNQSEKALKTIEKYGNKYVEGSVYSRFKKYLGGGSSNNKKEREKVYNLLRTFGITIITSVEPVIKAARTLL